MPGSILPCSCRRASIPSSPGWPARSLTASLPQPENPAIPCLNHSTGIWPERSWEQARRGRTGAITPAAVA
jgi:hypothetical protein